MTKPKKEEAPKKVVCSECKGEFIKEANSLYKNKFFCSKCHPEANAPEEGGKETADSEDSLTEKIRQAPDRLKGMREICQHACRSETTILGWIRCCDFPASKFSGGHQWQSTKSMIDTWWKTPTGQDCR
jgi:hypothetical protein